MGTDDIDADNEALEFGLAQPFYIDEHPQHRLTLPTFLIDQFEVTRADYQRFVQSTGHAAPEDWVNGRFAPERAFHPVVFVSWYDANDYCHWDGKRLLTEPEWEKAARGPDGLKYPWGNELIPERANISSGASLFGDSVPVGRYQAGKSPYGAQDLIGNVWEWTDSWYSTYPGNPDADKVDKFGRGLRVTRGLSFMSVGHYPKDTYRHVLSILARASFRSYDVPTSRLADVGFRCARSE